MENRIDDVEKLRKEVIKKHFKWYPAISFGGCVFNGSIQERFSQEKSIDDKVIYYIKLGITAEDLINKNGALLKKFDKKYGDVMTVGKYFECVADGGFSDYDGHIEELLDKDNNIIVDKTLYCNPSDIKSLKDALSHLQNVKKVVWYNR